MKIESSSFGHQLDAWNGKREKEGEGRKEGESRERERGREVKDVLMF